jgi:hypothetical protein
MYDMKQYPQPTSEKEPTLFGMYPMDFILEVIFEEGLEWFRNDKDAPNLVYGNLNKEILKSRYGQNKIDEISQWINDTEIRITQSWPTGAEQTPTISINLANGQEFEQHAALDDFAGNVDVLGGDDNSVVDRSEIGYSAIQDELLIGIHTAGTPDKTKYIHMLVLYLLNSYVDVLDSEGFFNVSFKSTDLSRLNEYLPQNMFSRFISITGETFAKFPKTRVPMLSEVNVDVRLEE